MKKNNFNNKLVKRKNLILLLKNQGINNIEKKSLETLEKYMEDKIKNLSYSFKHEMIINGRKVLKNKDVLNVLKEDENKSDFEEMGV